MRSCWLSRILFRTLVVIAGMNVLFTPNQAYGQGVLHLTITQAYKQARENYPLIKQRDLIERSGAFSVANAARGYLPVFSINGLATYQSTVTGFPFINNVPGLRIPEYSRDQYKIYAEINQVVYDGGIIKNQQQTAKTTAALQGQGLEVSLYPLYDRINQLYFGVLLIGEQLLQNALFKKDIQNGIDKAKARLANGTAYRSSVDELSAQLLEADQAATELQAARKAYAAMLSLFIGIPIDDNSALEKPASPFLSGNINRPEILYFDEQKKLDDRQAELLKAQLRPKLGFYAQEGYGRPGLNVLSNQFSWYYIGGLKLSWNFGGWYTFKNQQELLNIHKQTLDIQKETFLFNTAVTQKQQLASVAKYLELLNNDRAIILLRESVKEAAAAQLKNGVLSARDYISEVNAVDQARQKLILHEIQLLLEQYNYQNTVADFKEFDQIAK